MAGVRLEFAQFGHFDYFNIYRNSASTAIENLGEPIGSSSTMYYEDLTVESNQDYYYRAGVVRNSIEEFSGEFHVTTTTATHPILSLFENSEKGFWFDFSDMSSLYQDSAGTTPVTAYSQVFGKVLDKSGNGNHAAQTINASMPEFRSNGAYFDGNNHFLKTINNVDYGGSNNVEIFLKIESLYRSSRAYFFVIETGSTYNEKAGGLVTLSREASDSVTAGYSISTNSAQNVLLAHKGNGSTYSGVYSLSVTDTEFILDMISSGNTYRKTKPAGIPVPNNFLMIGARQDRSDFNFYGYIKQIVCVNRILTSVERSNLIAFMDAS